MNKFKNNMNLLDTQTLLYPRAVETTPIAYRHVIRINREIGEPNEWVDEISTIQNATPNDVLHITINSPGGSLYTTTEILSAMAQTEAHIVTEITGECCSAATLIFLAGHEYVISDDATWMSHTATFGAYGVESNVYDNVVHSRKQIHKLMRKYYKNFLTEEELNLMLQGKEFWMDAEEIIERLNKRELLFKVEEEQSQQDAVADLISEEDLFDVPSKEELESWSKEELISWILAEDVEEGEVKPEDEILEKQNIFESF